jgi:hypothetical protein
VHPIDFFDAPLVILGHAVCGVTYPHFAHRSSRAVGVRGDHDATAAFASTPLSHGRKGDN